jgi:hypothetical protein
MDWICALPSWLDSSIGRALARGSLNMRVQIPREWTSCLQRSIGFFSWIYCEIFPWWWFFSSAIICCVCVYFVVKYRWMLRERRTRQMFQLVDKILGMITLNIYIIPWPPREFTGPGANCSPGAYHVIIIKYRNSVEAPIYRGLNLTMGVQEDQPQPRTQGFCAYCSQKPWDNPTQNVIWLVNANTMKVSEVIH